MSVRYFAFISYSVTYSEWVAALQQNLEQCLEHYARTVDPWISRKVFLDQVDLRSGETWLEQIQQAIDQSERLILVVTPEVLDSKWVKIEWQSFFTRRPRDLFPILLVDTDLAAFLRPIQSIDFRRLEGAEYRAQMTRLFGDLLRYESRESPPMPAELVAPSFPKPDPDRRQLETCLAPLLESRMRRRLLASAFGLDRHALDDATGASAARRIAELRRFDDDRLANLIRIAQIVIGELEDCDIESLQQLETDLQRRQKEIESRRRMVEVDRGDLDDSENDCDPIRAYLLKVAKDHESLIPLFDRSRTPLLDHIYVELKLRDDERLHGLAAGRLHKTIGRPLGRAMTIHQVLDLEPAEHSWITRRWVVLGDPGAGKTTLMRHLARELALDEERTLVPVLESLPRLLREKSWMLDRIETQMIQGGEAEGLASTLDELGRRGELLLQLDGLDEVPRDQKADAASLLRLLTARWPETPILVTSRPIGYHHPGEGFSELEVQRFDGEQRLDFLTRWLGDTDRARKALAAIDTHRSVRDLAGNPLYLTLMAILVEQGIRPSENRAKLHDQIFKLLLEGRHKRPAQPMPLRVDTRNALRQLAYAMTEDNRYSEPLEEIESRFVHDDALVALSRPLVNHWREIGSFLNDLAEKTCILAPHDGVDADWRYWHRSFREALASEVLAQRYETGGRAAVLEAAEQVDGDESRWAEAFALLTGRVDAPDPLVKALVESKRELGLRALASAPTLDVSTIGEVLALTDDLEERGEVFLQIPELLPDAPSALAVIDRLRQDTRSGYDLYHLDLAVELVAEKPDWADHAQDAHHLRDQLYNHIPLPPADLFETVETSTGRVPLWCKIPAGRFLMGSADDERSHHEVMIESDYWIAAVPVTQGQYAAFEPGHSSRFEGDRRPVEQVTWYQAMAFCGWLARRGGLRGARLPTEAEWEYACRAGTRTRYWSGDSDEHLRRVGWYGANAKNQTHPVGEKPSNEWGLFDVLGNVWEWTVSPWASDYSERFEISSVGLMNSKPRSASSTDSLAVPAETRFAQRVIRGGSFWSVAQDVHSACRGGDSPRSRSVVLGFRVLLPAPPPRS